MIEQAETSKPLGVIYIYNIPTGLSTNHVKNVHKINVSPHSLQEILDLLSSHNSLAGRLRGRKRGSSAG